jgi:flagellar biosynthesis/type III secretory pathway chaperone
VAQPINSLAVLLDQLRQLLQDERAILLTGSPEQISAMAEQKLALAEMIERESAFPGTVPPDVDTLTWLARYNRENAVICSTILRHMTQAVDKLRQHEMHRSYGPDGTENVPPAQHTLGAA